MNVFSDSSSLKSTKSSVSSYKSIYSQNDKTSDNTVLYQELRLIERNEGEINVCWKGAHMMLFFMAFVFGALCTCCFHRLMYMFDEKCVLFPKVVSHTSIYHIVHEFFSYKPRTKLDELKTSTDYVSTQWADNSVCYLPTYVPLVSGLAGLVWTTMFLMCSSGISNVTGAQRHWRALPAMFFCSVTMSILCIYASTVTHQGLAELCIKLAEAVGSPSSTYSINVATLIYERRIRGVYQATRLSIASAWLHTGCWVLSTLLIVARVALAVDFTLVHVKAQLVGSLDDILQKHEKQINSYNAESATPLRFDINEDDSEIELFSTTDTTKDPDKTPLDSPTNPKQVSQSTRFRISSAASSPPATTQERQILLDKYVNTILSDLLKDIEKRDQKTQTNTPGELTDAKRTEILAKEFMKKLHGKLIQEFSDLEHEIRSSLQTKDASLDPENKPTGSEHEKIDNDENVPKKDVNKLGKKETFEYENIARDKINDEENIDNKTAEEMKNLKDISLKPFRIRFSATDSVTSRIIGKNSKKIEARKGQKKQDEQYQQSMTEIEELDRERELHIIADHDKLTKKHKKINDVENKEKISGSIKIEKNKNDQGHDISQEVGKSVPQYKNTRDVENKEKEIILSKTNKIEKYRERGIHISDDNDKHLPQYGKPHDPENNEKGIRNTNYEKQENRELSLPTSGDDGISTSQHDNVHGVEREEILIEQVKTEKQDSEHFLLISVNDDKSAPQYEKTHDDNETKENEIGHSKSNKIQKDSESVKMVKDTEGDTKDEKGSKSTDEGNKN